MSTGAVAARPVLEVVGLRRRYGGHDVLCGIDLAVGAGEVVCLIGASGSGKSTLLRCIDLLEPVDDGAVRLDGRDVTDPRVNADAVRREIGVVFQAYNLFPHLTVLDNVTLALRVVHRRGKGAARRDAERLLARFGLAGKAAVHPDSLSGGQQQRVALVRAVASRPRLLLLDEVTSALDPELVGEVLDMVAELRADGMTMLVATHELAFARDVADRVAFLHDGVVHEEGPAGTLLADPVRERTRAYLARFRGVR